jgi:hypothetical protein
MKRAALAAMGSLTLMGAGPPGQTACRAPYQPPHQPLLLTRALTRGLSDGKQIVITRSYLIHIVPAGRGYRVEGNQVSAEVSAPPPLAAMVATERARVDRETLPILLDHDGHILPGPEREAPTSAQTGKAVDALQAQSRMTPAQRAAASAVAHAMMAPGGHVITQWPEDVFNPRPGRREEVLHPSLPDGTQGEVVVAITGDCGKDAPLHLTRDVVTSIAGSSRHVQEDWTLEPARAHP